MKDNVIIDASTLILLAKTTIVKLCFDEYVCKTTETVVKEVLVDPEREDAKMIAHMLKHMGTPEVVHVQTQLDKELNLGRGEAECLELAAREHAILASDDAKAIKAGKWKGIPFLTAIHFLLLLFEKKKITPEEGIEKIKNLQKYGRYNALVIDHALHRIRGV